VPTCVRACVRLCACVGSMFITVGDGGVPPAAFGGGGVVARSAAAAAAVSAAPSAARGQGGAGGNALDVSGAAAGATAATGDSVGGTGGPNSSSFKSLRAVSDVRSASNAVGSGVSAATAFAAPRVTSVHSAVCLWDPLMPPGRQLMATLGTRVAVAFHSVHCMMRMGACC